MSSEEKIQIGLKSLAALETRLPSPGIEAFLIRKIKPRRRISWQLAFEAFAIAAVIAIMLYPAPEPLPPESSFIQVPFVDPVGPDERMQLVRVNIPVRALANWGLPVAGLNPDRRVDAEVVVGEDGLARAVRFIQ